MIKKILLFCGIIFSISLTSCSLASTHAYAQDFLIDNSCNNVLGFTSWNCGIKISSEETLKTGIWQIAANVATDITVAAAYLVLGYVIYGGYLYIFASGDPSKVATGKKTLLHAFTGLAIVMLSYVIMNAIRIALLGNSGAFGNCLTIESDSISGNGCIDATNVVSSAISWAITIAGLVSVIFIIYGGISYITSSGDPSKVKKAKETILYALIGLAIVGLAQVITAFVTNIIKDSTSKAQTTSIIESTTFSPNSQISLKNINIKESYE